MFLLSTKENIQVKQKKTKETEEEENIRNRKEEEKYCSMTVHIKKRFAAFPKILIGIFKCVN